MINYFAKKWALATVAGTTGLLFGGVGAMYSPEAISKIFGKNEGSNPHPVSNPIGSTQEDELQVADVRDDMSFDEAFSVAREEVGPGGVFYWHGGIYGTYYEDEWNAMTESEKSEFGERAGTMFPEPENVEEAIRPHDVEDLVAINQDPGSSGHEPVVTPQPTEPTTPDPQVLFTTTVNGHYASGVDLDGDGVADILMVDTDDSGTFTQTDLVIQNDGETFTGDGQYIGNINELTQKSSEEDLVSVVGYGEYDGHLVVGIDTIGDGTTDTAIIDVDDNGFISPEDIVVNSDGESTTFRSLGLEDATFDNDDTDSDLSNDDIESVET